LNDSSPLDGVSNPGSSSTAGIRRINFRIRKPERADYDYDASSDDSSSRSVHSNKSTTSCYTLGSADEFGSEEYSCYRQNLLSDSDSEPNPNTVLYPVDPKQWLEGKQPYPAKSEDQESTDEYSTLDGSDEEDYDSVKGTVAPACSLASESEDFLVDDLGAPVVLSSPSIPLQKSKMSQSEMARLGLKDVDQEWKQYSRKIAASSTKHKSSSNSSVGSSSSKKNPFSSVPDKHKIPSRFMEKRVTAATLKEALISPAVFIASDAAEKGNKDPWREEKEYIFDDMGSLTSDESHFVFDCSSDDSLNKGTENMSLDSLEDNSQVKRRTRVKRMHHGSGGMF